MKVWTGFKGTKLPRDSVSHRKENVAGKLLGGYCACSCKWSLEEETPTLPSIYLSLQLCRKPYTLTSTISLPLIGQSKYERHLLEFEREISRGAPRREVQSDWGKVAEEQRLIKKLKEERHQGAGGPGSRLGKRRVLPPKPKVGNDAKKAHTCCSWTTGHVTFLQFLVRQVEELSIVLIEGKKGVDVSLSWSLSRQTSAHTRARARVHACTTGQIRISMHTCRPKLAQMHGCVHRRPQPFQGYHPELLLS